MPHTIRIREVATGEEVNVQQEGTWADAEFIWIEGNYSCDDNRALFFDRAKGIAENDVRDLECSEGLFTITALEEGKAVYTELTTPPTRPA